MSPGLTHAVTLDDGWKGQRGQDSCNHASGDQCWLRAGWVCSPPLGLHAPSGLDRVLTAWWARAAFKMGKSQCICITFTEAPLVKASHMAKSRGVGEGIQPPLVFAEGATKRLWPFLTHHSGPSNSDVKGNGVLDGNNVHQGPGVVITVTTVT